MYYINSQKYNINNIEKNTSKITKILNLVMCSYFDFYLFKLINLNKVYNFFISQTIKQDCLTLYFYIVSFYFFLSNVINNLLLLTLYNYNILENKHNKKKLLLKKFSNNHGKFISILIKHGLKIQYINIYSKMFTTFYNNFQYFDEYLSNLFPLYTSFYNLSKSNIIFYVLDYFYQLLYNQYNYIFFVKIASIPRKLKKNKKTKKKYNTYLSYLKPSNRFKWMLKQIVASNVCFNFKKFVNRLSYAFTSVLLSPERNIIKEQQTRIYKNILKNKKNF